MVIDIVDRLLVDANVMDDEGLLRINAANEIKYLINENRILKNYEQLAFFIVNDYIKLSHDKTRLQRDDWRRRAEKAFKDSYLCELEDKWDNE